MTTAEPTATVIWQKEKIKQDKRLFKDIRPPDIGSFNNDLSQYSKEQNDKQFETL